MLTSHNFLKQYLHILFLILLQSFDVLGDLGEFVFLQKATSHKMKKKQRKENNKKKTKHNSIVTHRPILSTTVSSSPTLTVLLGAKLESLLCLSTPTEVGAAAVCKGIDDLAFSNPGNLTTMTIMHGALMIKASYVTTGQHN